MVEEKLLIFFVFSVYKRGLQVVPLSPGNCPEQVCSSPHHVHQNPNILCLSSFLFLNLTNLNSFMQVHDHCFACCVQKLFFYLKFCNISLWNSFPYTENA